MIDLDPIRARADLAAIAGGYGITLRRSGPQLTGRCPFHNATGKREKSISFYIHPGKGMYKCWSCGAEGDVFRFVEQIEHLDFRRAVVRVSELSGYPLETEPEWTAEQRHEYAERRKIAEGLAHEAGIWRELRLADLERAKRTGFKDKKWRWKRLAAAAREYYRIQQLDADGLMAEYRSQRTQEVISRSR